MSFLEWIAGPSPCGETNHQFEGRYDERLPERIKFERFVGSISTLKDRTYVRDVCVKCGKTIERTTPPPKPSRGDMA